jgi:predicted RNase H-like HicB family nuclease
MKSRYIIFIQWSDQDNVYLVHLPEFPGQQFVTPGETDEEAARNGQEVLTAFIEMCQEDGKPLPEPIAYPEKPLKVA